MSSSVKPVHKPAVLGTRRLMRTLSRGLGSPVSQGQFRAASCHVRPNWYGILETDEEHASVLMSHVPGTVIVRVAASTVWARDPFDAVVCWHRGVWWARVRTQDPYPMVCLNGDEAFEAVAEAAARWVCRPRSPHPLGPRPALQPVSLDRTSEDYMSFILFV
jgi:hypothetical protein